LFSVMVTIMLIVFFFGWLVWFGKIVIDLIIRTLVLKTKVVLITIYIASSFFCKYFWLFFSFLVISLDYFTGGCAKVHNIPAIRYNK
jgi:hypothetical protein